MSHAILVDQIVHLYRMSLKVVLEKAFLWYKLNVQALSIQENPKLQSSVAALPIKNVSSSRRKRRSSVGALSFLICRKRRYDLHPAQLRTIFIKNITHN